MPECLVLVSLLHVAVLISRLLISMSTKSTLLGGVRMYLHCIYETMVFGQIFLVIQHREAIFVIEMYNLCFLVVKMGIARQSYVSIMKSLVDQWRVLRYIVIIICR